MFGDERAWTLLNDLLVSTLDRAFSFAKMDSIALTVAEHLYLNMVAVRIIPFDEHAGILEKVFST